MKSTIEQDIYTDNPSLSILGVNRNTPSEVMVSLPHLAEGERRRELAKASLGATSAIAIK